MDIFRTNSKLSVQPWDDLLKCTFSLAPALAGNSKGQPKAGEQRYDYDKKINITMSIDEMLKCSYHLMLLAYNIETKYDKYADPSKSAHSSGDKKRLTISAGKESGISIFISQGDNKCSLTIGNDEAFALAKWLEIKAGYYINNPQLQKEE